MGSTPSGISASRGASVISRAKWSEPVSTWCKIQEERQPGFCETNLYPTPEFVDNADTRWGLALEKWIQKFAELEQGCEIIEEEKFSDHPDYPFITCHQDGRYVFSKTLHEGKKVYQRTFRNEWGEPGTNRVPRNYMIQAQHQMMVTGAEECIISALVVPMDADSLPDPSDADVVETIAWGLYRMGYFHQYPIRRNERLQKLMLEKYATFWNENILKKIPPKPESLDWVKKLIPKPKGTIIATEQIERWCTERSSIMGEIKNANARKDELAILILDYMRTEADLEDVCIDDESTEKLILLAGNGFRLASAYKNKHGTVTFR